MTSNKVVSNRFKINPEVRKELYRLPREVAENYALLVGKSVRDAVSPSETFYQPMIDGDDYLLRPKNGNRRYMYLFKHRMMIHLLKHYIKKFGAA